MKKIILAMLVVGLSLVIMGGAAFAVSSTDACSQVVNPGTTICNTGGVDAKTVAKNITNVLFWLVGVAAVVVIIYSGINFITASGDPSKITRAKTMLTYAIVGLVVALSTYAIVNFTISKL